MRMREPFNGYKLSSGHFMFHIAYLLGSRIATSVLSEEEMNASLDKYDMTGKAVLNQLNLAHILVPIFNLLIVLCEAYDSHVLAKLFETISIFQYQATIFIASFYQMW